VGVRLPVSRVRRLSLPLHPKLLHPIHEIYKPLHRPRRPDIFSNERVASTRKLGKLDRRRLDELEYHIYNGTIERESNLEDRKGLKLLWSKLVSTHILGALLSALAGFLANLIITTYGPTLAPIFAPVGAFIRTYIDVALFQIGFVVVVTGIAVALYFLRSKQRRIYASLEIMVGVFAAVYASNELYNPPTPDSRIKAVFATMGGLYIIVRGLDNWRQSQEKRT
jgi:hypothetical protein